MKAAPVLATSCWKASAVIQSTLWPRLMSSETMGMKVKRWPFAAMVVTRKCILRLVSLSKVYNRW